MVVDKVQTTAYIKQMISQGGDVKRFTMILATLAILVIPALAQAQTEVELAGVFGRPSLATDKIGYKFSGALLTKVDRFRLGFNDGVASSPFYGPLVAMSLGSWNISGGDKPKTIEVELMGFTDISGGFDFTNGAVGAGAVLDLMPGNRIKEVVRILWSDGDDMNQAWLAVVGARIDLE
jgi:hypothetical protein